MKGGLGFCWKFGFVLVFVATLHCSNNIARYAKTESTTASFCYAVFASPGHLTENPYFVLPDPGAPAHAQSPPSVAGNIPS